MSRFTDIFTVAGPVDEGEPAAHIRRGLGLASRLPRWRSFDGLHSRIAPSWADPHVAPTPARPPAGRPPRR